MFSAAKQAFIVEFVLSAVNQVFTVEFCCSKRIRFSLPNCVAHNDIGFFYGILFSVENQAFDAELCYP